MDLGWVEASGKGSVYSFTIIHHPQFPGYDFPIVAALVELEEGTRIVSNVVDCKPEDVRIHSHRRRRLHAAAVSTGEVGWRHPNGLRFQRRTKHHP
jgi:hypothetical protein